MIRFSIYKTDTKYIDLVVKYVVEELLRTSGDKLKNNSKSTATRFVEALKSLLGEMPLKTNH